jgi:hypothetical protein
LVASTTERDSGRAITEQKLDDQTKALIERVKGNANLKFDSTTPQLAIDTAAYELQRLASLTIAASVAEDGADALAAQQLSKEASQFSNLRFRFWGQSVSATIDYSGSVSVPSAGAVDVSAQLHAQLAAAVELATDQSTAQFRVRLAVTSLDLTGLRLSRNGQALAGFVNETVDALISNLLAPAQSLLNRIEFRLPTIIAAKIDIQPTKKDGITIAFDPKTVTPKVQIVASTHLLDRGRLTVIAQDAGSANNVPTKPQNVNFEAFRGNFEKAVKAAGVTWINQGAAVLPNAFHRTGLRAGYGRRPAGTHS